MKKSVKIISLFLISLFLVSLFLSVTVSAQVNRVYPSGMSEEDKTRIDSSGNDRSWMFLIDDWLTDNGREPIYKEEIAKLKYDDGITSTPDNTDTSLFGNPDSSFLDSLLNPIKNTFLSWEKGQVDLVVAKYFFLIIVFIFIFSTIKYAPVIGGNFFVRLFISIIVSFLGTAYITPEEVYIIMLSYTSLGFALSGILPLIPLVLFSVNAHSSKGSLGGIILSNILWWLFIGTILFKLVGLVLPAESSFLNGFFNTWLSKSDIPVDLSTHKTVLISYVLLFISSITLVTQSSRISKWIEKQEIRHLAYARKVENKKAREDTTIKAEDLGETATP